MIAARSFLTTAAELSVTPGRVSAMIAAGRLRATLEPGQPSLGPRKLPNTAVEERAN